MTADLYIGIDLGTTGVKAGVFDAAGRGLASSSREIELDTPAPGFAEFDADRYVRLAFDAIREALAAPGVDPAAVRAVGLSSQAQTFVLLDEDGRTLRPAVSWLDVRAESEAAELSPLAERAGARAINALASAPKVLWLRRHEPDVFARTRLVQLLPDHLLFRLTGRAASDPVTAASSGAYDARTGRWLDSVLDACGLSEAMMPDVLRPGEPAGPLTESAASELGLSCDVVAVVGTNDQYAGALGAGNAEPGVASLAMGTALALVATSSTRDGIAGGLGSAVHPAAPADGGLFVVLGFAKTSGVVVRWFREQLAPDVSYEDLFAEAAAVPPGADGVVCVPHFSGTATPDFDASVRGAFAGLHLSHGRPHLWRALIESLAFTVCDNVDLIERTVKVNEIRAIGGGARSDVWLQMIADATGVPVERPQTREAACLGAAALGMAGAGRYASVAEAVRALYRVEKRFEPAPALRDVYAAARERYHAVLHALR